jgi:hypothetical protein
MTVSQAQFSQLELPVTLSSPSLSEGKEPHPHQTVPPGETIPTDLVAKLTPTVEDTITRLSKTKFIVDPIAGQFISKIVSVMSSAYKRHGNILERAIYERLRENPRLEVWTDHAFAVSAIADNIASEHLKTPINLLDTHIPYETNSKRTLQLDIIVFDKETKTLRAYEIKRGNGAHDAGKKRQILRDTLCVQVLLKKYGMTRGFEASSVSSHVISYYGLLSVPRPFALKGTDLDQHFGFSVYAEIEKVNQLFKERLHSILNA